MQPQSRFGDQSYVPVDAHGKICCPHSAIGPATGGSPDVLVNNLPALRVTDSGVHSACCGPNTWVAMEGSMVVLINNLPAHRMFDMDMHCGGPGFMVEASMDVYVGECTETSLANAQQFTQALVPVDNIGVQVEPIPFQPINVEIVPLQMNQINVEAIPGPIGSDDEDPGTPA